MVTAITAVMVVMVVMVTGAVVSGEGVEGEVSGEHVCYVQTVESKLVNVTYQETIKVQKMEFCWAVPPWCKRWETRMEPRTREEAVTRLVNQRRCCPGYSEAEGGCSWCGTVRRYAACAPRRGGTYPAALAFDEVGVWPLCSLLH